MVAPELEVPGINAAHCAKPTFIASLMLKSSKCSILRKTTLRLLCFACSRCSAQRIMKPPTIKAVATGIGANKCALIYLPKMRARVIAGTDATMTFTAKRFDKGLLPSPLRTSIIFFRNSQHTARIAPN